MQINVANSNIVNGTNSSENEKVNTGANTIIKTSTKTIKNTGADSKAAVKNNAKMSNDKISGAKVQRDNDAIYKGNSKNDKIITYSKDKLGDEEQGKEKEQANMTSLIDSLNTMITPEGYNQMEELGLSYDDENPELSMTVYERIQMELATYCEDYNPTGLNIDTKKLEALLGSTAFANAVDKAMSIKNLDDMTKASIIDDENIDSLQIDKVYEKAYSSKSKNVYSENIYARSSEKISDEVWEELKPQVEKILSGAGIENTKEVEEISKWLVSKEIPVTKENISKAIELEKISNLDNEEYKSIVERNVAYSLYFTGNTKCATIEQGQYELDDVREAIDGINNITDGQLEKLVEDNKELNLYNIKKYASLEKIDNEDNKDDKDDKYDNKVDIDRAEKSIKSLYANDELNNLEQNSTKVITARKVVIEATLIMTTSSLMRVKQLGININVTSLTTLLDEINEMENKEAEKYLESVNANVTKENISTFISTNKAMVAIKQADFSFVAKVEKTDSLERVAKIAVSTYEESATIVRKDLGDSYEKAFLNIDNILSDLGLENNEENARAVKILGYNAMSINTASVEKVVEMAGQIDELVTNLNPKTVAHLIANDINPMKRNISELNDELKNINEEIGVTDESFAKYLWKLEKSNDISKEDRKKYIDLFRNIKSITKKDIQALGAVINSDMDFTMDSLLTAVKSRRVTGEIYKWKDDNDFSEYKLSMQKESVVTDDEVNQLINNHIAVTPRNIKNTGKLQKEKDIYKSLYDSSSDEVKDLVENILDADNTDELKDAFEKIYNETRKAVNNEIHKEFPLYKDIENALENSGLAKLVYEYAKNDSYFIPVKIGENITNIHLTLKSGEKESKAFVDIKDSSFGKLHLDIYENEGVFKGMIVCENKASMEIVSKMAAAFEEILGKNNIEVGKITVVNSETYTNTISKENKKEEKQDTKQNVKKLYDISKIFITTVRSYEIESIDR